MLNFEPFIFSGDALHASMAASRAGLSYIADVVGFEKSAEVLADPERLLAAYWLACFLRSRGYPQAAASHIIPLKGQRGKLGALDVVIAAGLHIGDNVHVTRCPGAGNRKTGSVAPADILATSHQALTIFRAERQVSDALGTRACYDALQRLSTSPYAAFFAKKKNAAARLSGAIRADLERAGIDRQEQAAEKIDSLRRAFWPIAFFHFLDSAVEGRIAQDLAISTQAART